MAKALITGASSGIGEAIALLLSQMGYETVLVARRAERLENLAKRLPTKSTAEVADLSKEEEVRALAAAHPDIDILVNNAGFGIYGEFEKTDFCRECEMIDVNIRAVQFLMKEYLRVFEVRGGGKILNVASSAAFLPGPLLSSYYASKAYVLRLSSAVREELRRKKSNITVSVLCPGPVDTEFGQLSGSHLGKNLVSADFVAKCAVKGLMKGKAVIVPSFLMKCARFFSKIVPESLSVRMVYVLQKAKEKEADD